MRKLRTQILTLSSLLLILLYLCLHVQAYKPDPNPFTKYEPGQKPDFSMCAAISGFAPTDETAIYYCTIDVGYIYIQISHEYILYASAWITRGKIRVGNLREWYSYDHMPSYQAAPHYDLLAWVRHIVFKKNSY